MSTYPDIKVWPYNIIAEAMGFTGKEKSNPFEAYSNDLDAVIAKAFREVRFTHTALSRTTVNRCLGAITDHYQRGDKIREILKDMHLGARTYYEVLHDVFAQIRVYIRVANTNSEPKASVPVTQPKWSNHTISKRQDLKKETVPEGEKKLSDTVDFKTWPWNVFQKAERRSAVDELFKPEANAKDVGNILMCLARMICNNYKQHDSMMTTFYDYFFMQKGSMKELSLRYACSATKVRKDIERVTNCISMLIDMHRAMWPGEPIHLDRDEIKYLAGQGIEDVHKLSYKEYASLDYKLTNTQIVNLCKWLLTRVCDGNDLVLTTFHKSQVNKAAMLTGYNVKYRHNLPDKLTRYEPSSARKLLNLSKDMISYLAGVPYELIAAIHLDKNVSGILFEMVPNKAYKLPRIYHPLGVTAIEEYPSLYEAKVALYQIDEANAEATEDVKEQDPTGTVRITIEIPKEAQPAYFIEGQGYILTMPVED